ncbi:hypothetical protein [Flavobacterium sp.]|uniref:hypothetical protein n=1 Tax=Flavobacterium sp. TaxID=239 RepID=UPI0037526B70
MTLNQKFQHLENFLYQEEQNYADSFKTDIAFYFDEDFSEENQQLSFLNNLNSKKEIETFINNLTSKFVLKFDENQEAENDFIDNYINTNLSSTNQ